MVDNALKSLRCGVDGHAAMTRLLEERRPYQSGAFTLWVCPDCGMMALHLESAGGIMWYSVSARTRIDENWPVGLEADGSHLAKCGYCPERFNCSCGRPGQGHMCPRCDDAAEESKMTGAFHTGDPGERADEARQVAAYETDRAEADDTTRDPQGTVDRLAGEDLPW